MFPFFRKKENRAAGTLAVGCGGCGCNIAGRLGMISSVDILTVNTDRKGLVRTRSDKRILLGDGSVTEGCGGDTERGMALAKAAVPMISEDTERYLNVVPIAGLGGGTGTSAVRIIAETAKKNGSRVIVMAVLPMSFESGRRDTALSAIDGIKRLCDILFLLDGERLAAIDPMIGAREAFSVLDEMMCESFLGLLEVLEGSEGGSVYQILKGRTVTVSFAEGTQAGSVADKLIRGIMMDAPVTAQPVIFVSGNIPPDGSERVISDRIEAAFGTAPVYVQGRQGRGMSLMMFVPVQ